MNSTTVISQYEILSEELKSRSTGLTVVEAMLYILVALVGIVGNALVLWILYKKRNENRMTYYLIGSLAVSDLFLPVLAGWQSAAVLGVGQWPFNHYMCQFQGFVVMVLGFASLWTLALTALNRYFKVVRPNSYSRYFSKKQTRIFILLSWVLSFGEPIAYLAIGKTYKFHTGKVFCFQDNTVWYIALLTFLYCSIPMTFVIGCYYTTFKTIRKHQKRIKTMASRDKSTATGPRIEEIKATRTVFVTVVGFLLCWVPIIVIDAVDFVRGFPSASRHVYVMYTFFGNMSGTLNPFIYGALNRSFRKGYKKYLGFCCTATCKNAVALPPTSRSVNSDNS